MKFNIRIDNLEVRSCNENLLSVGDHTKAEIVKWEDEASCYTLAYWTKDSEGYDLQFVGNRPFGADWRLFMDLAQQGQKLLDTWDHTE